MSYGNNNDDDDNEIDELYGHRGSSFTSQYNRDVLHVSENLTPKELNELVGKFSSISEMFDRTKQGEILVYKNKIAAINKEVEKLEAEIEGKTELLKIARRVDGFYNKFSFYNAQREIEKIVNQCGRQLETYYEKRDKNELSAESIASYKEIEKYRNSFKLYLGKPRNVVTKCISQFEKNIDDNDNKINKNNDKISQLAKEVVLLEKCNDEKTINDLKEYEKALAYFKAMEAESFCGRLRVFLKGNSQCDSAVQISNLMHNVCKVSYQE
ncbi:MAG: hypothetical protein RR400_04085, partial [Clostridia bacterium]